MEKVNLDNKIIGVLIGLIVALVMIFLNNTGLLDQFESKLLDLRFKIASRIGETSSDRIKIIGIDDSSVAKIGRWPWKRDEQAKIIKFLKLYDAKAVVFDLFFSYKDNNNINSDESLANAAKNAGNSYFASKFISIGQDNTVKTKNRDNILKKFSIKANVRQYKDSKDYTDKRTDIRYEIPFEELSNVAKGIGLVHVGKQDDGIVRYQDLIYKYNNRFYSSLALSVAMNELGVSTITSTDEGYLLDKLKIPLDDRGRMIVNWHARYDKKISAFRPYYDQYSAWRFVESYDQLKYASRACGLSMEKFKDLLDKLYISEIQNKPIPKNLEQYLNKIPPDFELKFGGNNPSVLFKDKIVFIGVASTSTTMRDVISVPVLHDIPGVYVHANVLDNILSNDFIVKLNKAVTNIIILLVGLLVGIIVSGQKNSIKGMTYPVVFVLFYILFAFTAFVKFNLWVDTTYTLGTMVITYTLCSALNYIMKDKEESKVRKAMSNYISPQIMADILSDPSKLELGGTKKEITIMFSDIRGFTAISEKRDPQEVVSLLNRYLSVMVDIIFKNNGTFDKFIGDAIMAFWNAPIDTVDHEYLAIKTALEMVEELKKLNEKFDKEGRHHINIGIAVNTGDAIIGNIGSQKIKDYTIIGDAVNLTSRLESLNKKYSTNIIISESTYKRVKDKVDARFIDETEIKGKDKTVRIYEVLGIKKV